MVMVAPGLALDGVTTRGVCPGASARADPTNTAMVAPTTAAESAKKRHPVMDAYWPVGLSHCDSSLFVKSSCWCSSRLESDLS